MLSSYRPLIAKYNLTSFYANKYWPFVVNLYTRTYNSSEQQYEDINTPIYAGKTWCSATTDGATTTVNVTDIVRNYAYRQELVFNPNSQQWRPMQVGDYPDPLSHPALVPVEHWDEPQIVNCSVNVDVGIPGAEWRYSIPLNTFLPTKEMLEYKNIPKGYIDDNPSLSLWYKYFTDIQPEYPYKLTDNYWIGCDFTLSPDHHDENVEIRAMTMLGNRNFRLPCNGFGNYSTYITLSQLFGELGASRSDRLFIGIEHLKDMSFAKLDNGCFHDYYIGWMLPTGAWFSWGFEERHLTRSSESSKETIQTLYDRERSVRDTERYTFSLSRTVNRETARVLQTLGMRGEVYLYDTKQDRGDWCSVETTNFELGSNGLVDFNVDLKVSEIYQTLL